MVRLREEMHVLLRHAFLCGLIGLLVSPGGARPQQTGADPPPPDETRTAWILGFPTVPVKIESEITWVEDGRDDPHMLDSFATHATPSVRARTAVALGRIGSPESFEPLSRLLEDHDARVRGAAAFGIGEMTEPQDETGPALRRHLTPSTEADPATRALAAEALAKLGIRDEPGTLLQVLDDPDRRVVESVLLSLWRLSPDGMAEKALELTSDPQPGLRWKAAYALMRLSGAPPSGRTAVPESQPLSDETKARIKDRFLELLSDPTTVVRLQAVRALGGMESEELIAPLRKLENDGDPRVRSEVARALGRLEAASDAFGALLQDAHGPVRLEAIRAMASCPDQDTAFQALEPLLYDKETWIREASLVSCTALLGGDHQPEDAAARREAILRTALGETDWRLRAQAVSLAADAEPDGSVLTAILAGRENEWTRSEDPRVLKFAVGPLLRATANEHPSLERGGPLHDELDWWMGHHDEIVRAMAADFLMTFASELQDTESDGDNAESQGLPTEIDREAWFKRLYELAEAGFQDSSTEVRTIFIDGLAGLKADAPNLKLLSDALDDADYLVRSRARKHLFDRGIQPTSPARRAEGMNLGEIERTLRDARAMREARIVTSRGTLVLRLFPDQAPLTVANFARLAAQGYFDEKMWHRVVPDFVAQDGCPRGDGWGGPGYAIRCEISTLRYGSGALGMALSGKDTGGSQYFITHSPQPHLDGGYTVFGQLLDGWDTLQRLVPGDRIVSVRVTRNP